MTYTAHGTRLTERNQPMRQHIAQVLIEMMERKSLDDITITDIVREANISRMTFYKYFKTKLDVISDHMREIASSRVELSEQAECQNHVRQCFEHFSKYSEEIRTLLKADMYAQVMRAFNEYMDGYFEESKKSSYERNYYAGALFNTYIMWLESGMKETPQEIADFISKKLVLA